jgi:hypothetical protein
MPILLDKSEILLVTCGLLLIMLCSTMNITFSISLLTENIKTHLYKNLLYHLYFNSNNVCIIFHSHFHNTADNFLCLIQAITFYHNCD